jgi:hypothetical protein
MPPQVQLALSAFMDAVVIVNLASATGQAPGRPAARARAGGSGLRPVLVTVR